MGSVKNTKLLSQDPLQHMPRHAWCFLAHEAESAQEEGVGSAYVDWCIFVVESGFGNGGGSWEMQPRYEGMVYWSLCGNCGPRSDALGEEKCLDWRLGEVEQKRKGRHHLS